MNDLTPGEVALGDQWHAEIMDEARTLTNHLLAAQDVTLDADERQLVELGYTMGSSATFIVLRRKGWLRKPEDNP